jgi:uncharacterized protein involved in outer membrane biogenesis
MKKVLVVLGVLLLLLIAAVIILPMLFEGKIKEMVKQEANKRIAAVLDFDDVGLSLIRHFPKATITIDNLTVVNKEPFSGDTLAVLGRFEGTVNLSSLIGSGPIEVASLYLIDPRIQLRTLKDGRSNWNIMAESEPAGQTTPDSSESELNLAVRKYQIRNGDISYDDESSDMHLTVDGLNHEGRGDFSQEQFRLFTTTQIDSFTIAMEGVDYLNRARVSAAADIDVNLAEGKYTFGDNEIELNDLPLRFTGWLAQTGDSMRVDMSFEAPNADLKNLLSMIPYIYQADFRDLSAEGTLSLKGEVKGTSSKSRIPGFDLAIGLQNGHLKYAQLPTSVEKVGVNVQISNHGVSLDNTVVNVETFHCEILGKPLDVNGTIRTLMSDPYLDLSVNGAVDLKGATTAFPIEDAPEISGLVNAQLQLKGSVSAAQKGQMDRFSTTGKIKFANVEYDAPDLPDKFTLSKADISFSPQRVSLDDFNSTIGKSDLSTSGLLENVVGYVFGGQTLKGTLAAKSHYFDLNPWMSGEGGEFEAVVLPAGVEFLLQADFDEVTLENLDLTDVSGSLQLKDQTLSLLGLTMNALKGSLTATGSYSYLPPQEPHLFLDANATELSIPTTFEKMTTVQRFAPITQYLTGSYSGKININSDLDASLLPVWQDFFSKGELSITKANLQDFLPLNKVADALQLTQLKNPTLQNLDPAYLIEGGRFNLKPISLKIDKYNLTASGSNGLDKSIDYLLKIQVPASELKSKTNSIISGLVGSKVDALTNETVIVDVNVGGTLTNPTVKTSLGGIVKGAGDQVKGAATAEADKQKAEAEKKLQDEMDAQKKELEKKKKEAEEKLKDKLEGLFKKP